MTTAKDPKALQDFQNNVVEYHKKEMNDIRNAQEERAKDQREAEFALRLKEFQDSRITKGGKDKGDHSDWDAAWSIAEEDSGTTAAYNSEWKIAMLGLIGMLMKLNVALSNTVTEASMTPWFMLKEGIRSKLPSLSKNDSPLPTLLHGVSINDKNVLEVNITKKSDTPFNDDPNQPSFNDQFKRVVVEFLKEEGYKPDQANSGQFVDADGKTLDSKTFEKELKPKFEAYLHDNSDLEFEDSPGLRPS